MRVNIKKIIFVLLINVLCFQNMTRLSAQNLPREEINFNFGWKFHLGANDSAKNAVFDDSAWHTLDLPHDFQIEQTWDKSAGGNRGFKAMGEAWYRKTFTANSTWKGRRILLDFEGIMLVGDVYFNGRKVGGTDYGYIGFEVDVTKLVNFEEENVVAVWCSTSHSGGSRWYTGGGIFRDVHLLVKDSISVARNGIYITTPKISETNTEIAVQVEINNLNKKKNDISISAKIFAPDGKQVGEAQTLAPKTKKQNEEVALPLVSIVNPQLWDCENPHLYTAEITLTSEGKVIDRVTETFGIRTIEFSKEFGFKLNGKKVFLKGVANHHDLGAVGAAAYERSIERLFIRLKEFGYNHVRTSHNPYSKSFLKLADKYGILITDELYDKWSDNAYWGGREKWSNLWYKHVPEWIKRDRNHPSVILWSFGNELQMREDLAGLPTGDWGVTTYRMMNVLAKRFDNTRPSTVAMFPARAGAIGKNDSEFNTKIIPPELSTVTEIASFNYRWMNYQDYLKHAPHMIMYQSEATTNELLAPFFGMDYDKMVGLAYWGAVEYWGESNGYPKKGWAYSYFNHALEPFPQAYLIKSAFSDEPLVHIGVLDKASESEDWNEQNVGTQQVSSHWNREKGKRYNIFTYTNADEVELLLNGKSLGKQQNNRSDINKRNVISWNNVPYETGKIVAIARNGEMEAARHTLETTGKAIALKMELETPNDFQSDGMDLQYVKVYAVDSKGRVVPTSEGEVTFEVSGAAKLIAVDNGDHYSDELFSGNKRLLHNGFALAILRSTQTAGEVKIKASVNGLKSVKKTISTFNN
jgi:beta-galactosidase